MLTEDFLLDFKRRTEEHWHWTDINPAIFGFQFQRGTRWNPGLSEEEIGQYEAFLQIRFPDDFRKFLRATNGTDLPTLNIYANSGEPQRQSVGVYSYPRDLASVKRRIAAAESCRSELIDTLSEQGFGLAPEHFLLPVYINRYVVCTSDPTSSAVLSIGDGTDAIVYGKSLREYLEKEFLLSPDRHHKW